MIEGINPYYNNTLLEFFLTLLSRCVLWVSGDGGDMTLMSDEIQLLVLCQVAVSSALVGCFLVLRRMTMLANSLSHTILLGIIVAFLIVRTFSSSDGHNHDEHLLNLNTLFIASILTGVLTTFLTQALSQVFRLQEDAATGLVFTSMFALGILLVTVFARNAHLGAEVVMGNVDGLLRSDVSIATAVMVLNVVLILALYKEFQVTTFDSRLSQTLGFSASFFNYLLMIQVSATAVAAFRAVGVLMFLALITAPALVARLLTDRLKTMLMVAIATGVLGSALGVGLARHIWSVHRMSLSTAGLVVCVLVGLYLLALLFAPRRGLIARLRARDSLRSQMNS